MTKDIDIEEIRHWMRLSHKDFAKGLRVSTPTLWRWRKNGVPAGPARKLFEKLHAEMLADRALQADPWAPLINKE